MSTPPSPFGKFFCFPQGKVGLLNLKIPLIFTPPFTWMVYINSFYDCFLGNFIWQLISSTAVYIKYGRRKKMRYYIQQIKYIQGAMCPSPFLSEVNPRHYPCTLPPTRLRSMFHQGSGGPVITAEKDFKS